MKKTYGSIVVLIFMAFIISSCGGGSGNGPTAAPNVVFITSASGNGDLSQWPDALAVSATGLAAGDAICQARANAAGLPGTYKAWLSTSTTDAYCHIQGFDGYTKSGKCGQASLPVAAGPWVRTDGYPFADTIDKLVDNASAYGQVFAPVLLNENGDAVVSSWYYTGTYGDGTVGSTHCNNWTSNASSSLGDSGNTWGTTGWWSDGGGNDCDSVQPLLCMQTGTGGPLPSLTIPAGAKKVFVTHDAHDAILSGWPDAIGTGIAAGDAVCQARATSAGLTGTFKAWLSDDSTDAVDHVTAGATTDGPFYRLDGVKIADNKAELAIAPLFTAITYTETGLYYEYYAVWTGTNGIGTNSGKNCSNWTSNSTQGTWGNTSTAEGWTSWDYATCGGGFNATLYCFEDD
jgi:hypothetical protein